MVVDLPRRWQRVILAMCAVVLVLLVAFALIVHIGGRAGDGEALRAAAAASRPVAALVPSATAPDRPAALRPATGELQGARGVDEIQVCGGVWVKTRADGSVDPREFERAARLPEAREQILATLRADPGELARAAALWLEQLGAIDERRRASVDTAAGRDALARMAVSSADPRVYALALNACGGGARADGACQMLSAGQWARLDPGNASPWLFMLSDARVRRERAGQDEALHRIATAQRSDLGTFVIPGLIANAASADEASLLAAWSMASEMIAAQSAWSLPGYQWLNAACRADALRDASRRQTCVAIADVLSERSDTLAERTLGAAIGRQIGWPADRSDRLRGESAAYAATTAALAPRGHEYSCAKIRRDLDVMRHLAVFGEAGALREWVAQSGKTADDFVREERARQSAVPPAPVRPPAEPLVSVAASSALAARP